MPEQDFLLEIGTEEIPVGYLPGALAQLAEGLEAWLAEQRLAQRGIQRFATARRLALLVEGLQLRQEDRDEEVTGPPEAAAFKDGEPTKAALGFARGQGGAPEDLYVVDTPKGRYVDLRRRPLQRNLAHRSRFINALRRAFEDEGFLDRLEPYVRAVKEATGRKGKGLFMPLRKALTGLDHGPDMAALMPLLQKVNRPG